MLCESLPVTVVQKAEALAERWIEEMGPSARVQPVLKENTHASYGPSAHTHARTHTHAHTHTHTQRGAHTHTTHT